MRELEVPLVDPETHGTLAKAGPSEIAKLRDAIAKGRAKRRGGREIGEFDGAYLAESRRVAYLVEDGIPNFVIDERVEIDAAI
jgi:hypothetical protein